MDSKSIPLGKQVEYSNKYNPSLLCPIARPNRRDSDKNGFDRWVSYELTWLSKSSAPQFAGLEFVVPATSPFIVESKSLKLYLGSFAQEKFGSPAELLEVINKDLAELLQSDSVVTRLIELNSFNLIGRLPGVSIDSASIECREIPEPDSKLLITGDLQKRQQLHSEVFRSLCPVTGQPDYASVLVEYEGSEIAPNSLFQYLASYRSHGGFHETCCEQIFADITEVCKPNQLLVACFFTRRGGIEINPLRSSAPIQQSNYFFRCSRQ